MKESAIKFEKTNLRGQKRDTESLSDTFLSFEFRKKKIRRRVFFGYVSTYVVPWLVDETRKQIRNVFSGTALLSLWST